MVIAFALCYNYVDINQFARPIAHAILDLANAVNLELFM